ncbi:MAG: CAP domain-containing protein [Anaerolineales bacterium]
MSNTIPVGCNVILRNRWPIVLFLLFCMGCSAGGSSPAVEGTPIAATGQAALSVDLTTAITQASDSILAAVNVRRALAGIPPLIQQPALVDAALERSVDMAVEDYLAHVDPADGSLEPERILRSAGFLGQAAELLNQFQGSIDDVPGATVAAWFEDDDHSLILLSPEFRYSGTGVMGDGERWIVTMILTGDIPQEAR